MFNKRLSLRGVSSARTRPDALHPDRRQSCHLPDLALDPAMEIRRLMQWIGLEYEPTQLEY